MKVIIFAGTMDQLIVTGFLQYDLCDSCNCFIFKGLIFMCCWELTIHHLTFLAFSSSSFLSSQYHPVMKNKLNMINIVFLYHSLF